MVDQKENDKNSGAANPNLEIKRSTDKSDIAPRENIKNAQIQHQSSLLDDALAETFPASDPISVFHVPPSDE